MTKNLVFHAHTKHIKLDYHFIWEKVALGYLVLKCIPSSLQIVDVLTKPLHKQSFKELWGKLRVHLLPLTSLEGLDKVIDSLTKNNGDHVINRGYDKELKEKVSIPTMKDPTIHGNLFEINMTIFPIYKSICINSWVFNCFVSVSPRVLLIMFWW